MSKKNLKSDAEQEAIVEMDLLEAFVFEQGRHLRP